MKPGTVPAFPPSQEYRDRLRKTCTADDGTVFADIRWWPEGNCLAIWELRQDGQTWIPRKCIVDGKRRPRQVDWNDIKDCERDFAAARNAFDRHWYEREVVAHNEKIDADATKVFHDEVEQIGKMASEIARRGHCWHGDDPNTCKTCRIGEKLADEERAHRRDNTRRTFKVNDMRRVV